MDIGSAIDETVYGPELSSEKVAATAVTPVVEAAPYPDEPPAYMDAPPPGHYEPSPFANPPDWAVQVAPAVAPMIMLNYKAV